MNNSNVRIQRSSDGMSSAVTDSRLDPIISRPTRPLCQLALGCFQFLDGEMAPVYERKHVRRHCTSHMPRGLRGTQVAANREHGLQIAFRGPVELGVGAGKRSEVAREV